MIFYDPMLCLVFRWSVFVYLSWQLASIEPDPKWPRGYCWLCCSFFDHVTECREGVAVIACRRGMEALKKTKSILWSELPARTNIWLL